MITINENFEFDLDYIKKILGHYITLMRFDEKGKNPEGWQLAIPPKYLRYNLGSLGISFHNNPQDGAEFYFIFNVSDSINTEKSKEIVETIEDKFLKVGIPKHEIEALKKFPRNFKVRIIAYRIKSKQEEQKILEAVVWVVKYLKQDAEKPRGRM